MDRNARLAHWRNRRFHDPIGSPVRGCGYLARCITCCQPFSLLNQASALAGGRQCDECRDEDEDEDEQTRHITYPISTPGPLAAIAQGIAVLATLAIFALLASFCSAAQPHDGSDPGVDAATPAPTAPRPLRIILSAPSVTDPLPAAVQKALAQCKPEPGAAGGGRGAVIGAVDADDDGVADWPLIRVQLKAVPANWPTALDWEGRGGENLSSPGPAFNVQAVRFANLTARCDTLRPDLGLGYYGLPFAQNVYLCPDLLADRAIAGMQHEALRGADCLYPSGYVPWPGDQRYWLDHIIHSAQAIADGRPVILFIRSRYPEGLGAAHHSLELVPEPVLIQWIRWALEDGIDGIWAWTNGEPDYRRYSVRNPPPGDARAAAIYADAKRVFGTRYLNADGTLNEALVQSDCEAEQVWLLNVIQKAISPPTTVPTPPATQPTPPATQPQPHPLPFTVAPPVNPTALPLSGGRILLDGVSDRVSNDASIAGTLAPFPGLPGLWPTPYHGVLVNDGAIAQRVQINAPVFTALLSYAVYLGGGSDIAITNPHFTAASGTWENAIRIHTAQHVLIDGGWTDYRLGSKDALRVYKGATVCVRGHVFKGGSIQIGWPVDKPGGESADCEAWLIDCTLDNPLDTSATKYPRPINIHPGCKTTHLLGVKIREGQVVRDATAADVDAKSPVEILP